MPMCALGWLMVALPADAGVRAYCGRGLPGRVPPSSARVGRVPPEIRHPLLRDRAVRRHLSEQNRDRAGGWCDVRRRSGAADPAVTPGHIPRIDGGDIDRPAESPPLSLE